MNRPTVYCVNISPKFKPVTVLPSSLAADRVTVDATFTEDAGDILQEQIRYVYAVASARQFVSTWKRRQKEWVKQIGQGNL